MQTSYRHAFAQHGRQCNERSYERPQTEADCDHNGKRCIGTPKQEYDAYLNSILNCKRDNEENDDERCNQLQLHNNSFPDTRLQIAENGFLLSKRHDVPDTNVKNLPGYTSRFRL